MKSNIIELNPKSNKQKQTFKSLCQCIDTYIIAIDTQAGKKHRFVLKLEDRNSGEIIYKYLSTELSPSGNYSVKPCSDFAKLYRLTFGENPSKRYCKANQLLGHFQQQEFAIEYEEETRSDDIDYNKATSICPINPIAGDEWTATGDLRKKSTKRKPRSKTTSAKPRLKVIDILEKSSLNLGDDKTLETAETLGLEHDFNPHTNIEHINTIQLNNIALPEINNINNIYAREKDENLNTEEMSYDEFCRYHMIDGADYVDNEEFESHVIIDDNDSYADYIRNTIIPF